MVVHSKGTANLVGVPGATDMEVALLEDNSAVPATSVGWIGDNVEARIVSTGGVFIMIARGLAVTESNITLIQLGGRPTQMVIPLEEVLFDLDMTVETFREILWDHEGAQKTTDLLMCLHQKRWRIITKRSKVSTDPLW